MSPQTKMNGLLKAVHESFDRHLPLVLSPDHIWLAIAQGFAEHVNANSETLRSRLVSHAGKVNIVVIRDAFVWGSADNDWPGTFDEFSNEIAEHIGKKRDLLVSNFSTTGRVEKSVSEIVLMDAMQAYLSYECRTCCGIPDITLLGTVGDWENIRERARGLAEYDCGDWIRSLDNLLGRFVLAFKGSADPEFWRSFYHEGGGSGGPFVTGALNLLFPYLRKGRQDKAARNRACWGYGESTTRGRCGPNVSDVPYGLSAVPFVWSYYGQPIKMRLLGGFVGAALHDDQMTPSIGWGVGEAQKETESK